MLAAITRRSPPGSPPTPCSRCCVVRAGLRADHRLLAARRRLLTPLGGFLFGIWIGAALSVIAATLGAVAVFLAARTAFRDLFHARAGAALRASRRASPQRLQLSPVPAAGADLSLLADQHRAGAARHEARALRPGDADRHRPGGIVYAGVGDGLGTAAREGRARRISASSSNGASCCRCSASPPWRWCRSLCTRLRRVKHAP